MDSVIDLSNNWGLLDTGPSRTKRNSCVGAARKASPNCMVAGNSDFSIFPFF